MIPKFFISLVLFLLVQSTGFSSPFSDIVQAKVIYVVDGSTLWVRIHDKSLEERYQEIPVYFFNVSVAAFNPQIEKDAIKYLRKTLEGKEVWLELNKEKIKKLKSGYRLPAFVWESEPISSSEWQTRYKLVNAKLVLFGYAERLKELDLGEYEEWFEIYQKEARDKSLGIWKYRENKPAYPFEFNKAKK